MKAKLVRLLLVEDRLEELCLFNEIVSELNEEHRHRRGTGGCELIHALSAEEAIDLLSDIEIDAVLLEAAPETFSPVAALCALRACRPEVPVIAISDGSSVQDETRLIRLGAQDVLSKSDIDCLPLARAVRFAIERQRVLTSLRMVVYQDELTGLYNALGFDEVAGHVLKTSRAARLECGLVVCELAPAAGAYRDTDLALIEFADRLRSIALPLDILGRIAQSRFAALTPENGSAARTASFVHRLRSVSHGSEPAIAIGISEPARSGSLQEMLESAGATFAAVQPVV